MRVDNIVCQVVRNLELEKVKVGTEIYNNNVPKSYTNCLVSILGILYGTYAQSSNEINTCVHYPEQIYLEKFNYIFILDSR